MKFKLKTTKKDSLKMIKFEKKYMLVLLKQIKYFGKNTKFIR